MMLAQVFLQLVTLGVLCMIGHRLDRIIDKMK
jgi:hypothetical protein